MRDANRFEESGSFRNAPHRLVAPGDELAEAALGTRRDALR